MKDESGQVYKFKNIELRDSLYYGMGREYINKHVFISRVGSKTRIDSAMYKTIYVTNAKKSRTGTVLIVLAVTIPIFFLTLSALAFAFSG